MSAISERESLRWQPREFAVDVTRRADGCILIAPRGTLGAPPERVTQRLEYWAHEAGDRPFVAARDDAGAWRTLSYAQTFAQVRRIGAALLRRPLSAERPIAILSGNSIEHLLLALAAMHVGIPYVPVSPSYSLASEDLGKLRHVVTLLTPGLIAVFGGAAFERALTTLAPHDAELLTDGWRPPGRAVTAWSELLDEPASGAVEAAYAGISGDAIAKFLLTSGSTGLPKAVVTTHRMLNVNQLMLHQVLPFLVEEPPVLVDWLPWNHTFGGSHNVGLALFNGGVLHIDAGRPVADGFETTVRNLKEISPTVYFNVPRGFEMLADRLALDAALRRSFYRRLRACFFAGAGLSQHVWDALDAHALAQCGERVPMLSGLGATETAPSVTFTLPQTGRARVIGLPAIGNRLKLAPVGDKLELRVQGPNVMPGYWRDPQHTRAAFDEEGYYCLGDAVRLLDPADPAAGLMFDGRLTEDFKLSSGTRVSVGPLRAALLEALAPLAFDVVIAGPERDFLTLLVVLHLPGCLAQLPQLPQLPRAASLAQLAADPALSSLVRERLQQHAARHPGNSQCVRRAVILTTPPSLDGGEITDKGSINQRAVLQRRVATLELLYAQAPPAQVLCIVP